MPRSSLHRWIVVVMVALLAAACGPTDKSPLATWDPSTSDGFLAPIAGIGTLEISARCVRLIQSNQDTVVRTVLPVWPEPTSWNASSQVIEFVEPFGERFELRDGDQIVLGGVTMTTQQFVSPPDPSCKADETVIVNSVGLVTD